MAVLCPAVSHQYSRKHKGKGVWRNHSVEMKNIPLSARFQCRSLWGKERVEFSSFQSCSKLGLDLVKGMLEKSSTSKKMSVPQLFVSEVGTPVQLSRILIKMHQNIKLGRSLPELDPCLPISCPISTYTSRNKCQCKFPDLALQTTFGIALVIDD